MSELGDLENAIVASVAAIEDGGEPLFATVKAASGRKDELLAAAIRRERQPAAYVVFAGRMAATDGAALVGDPRFSLIVAAESLRGGSEPRLGGEDATGAFTLLDKLAVALQARVVLTDRRLVLVDEGVVATDERSYVARQRYQVRRVAQSSPPTFDGQAICGSQSLVEVLLGPLRADAEVFSFPGVDGLFRRHLGVRSRQIVWRGQLRASSDAELNGLEANLEALVAAPEAATMVDPWGRTLSDCVVDGFERRGPRRKDHYTGLVTQDFELVFVQLNPI